MKNVICTILYFILIIGVPVFFTLNGFGVTTWQWWAVTSSILVSYNIGVIRGMNFDN